MIDIQSLLSKASKLIHEGQLDEAYGLLHDILNEEPSHIDALSGCAAIENLKGNTTKAIEFLKQADQYHPKNNQILSNLGHAYMAAGDNEHAYKAFEQAYQLAPQMAEISYWFGVLVEKRRDFVRAQNLFEETLKYDPQNREAYLHLSDVYYQQGLKQDAFDILRKAEILFPKDKQITYLRGDIALKNAPGWHLPMLDDKARNDAYEQAINEQVKAGDIVLDIGTGSGLLAMMAARAGAAHVYACEVNAVLASIARDVIKKNGYVDKITILEKHSTDIAIGQDMPVKADVLVTEIFDSAVVGEGVLPTLHHAWQYLLKEKAHVIPQKATLYGQVTQCPHLKRFYNTGQVNGFDLSPMNVLGQPFSYKDAQIYFDTSEDCKKLNKPVTLQSFDMLKAPNLTFKSQVDITIEEAGNADSILLWFELEFTKDCVFSTQNSQAQHHWRPVSQIMLESHSVEAEDRFNLSTDYDGYFDFSLKKKS